MKKVSLISLVLLFALLVLAGCSSSPAPAQTTTAPRTTPPAPTTTAPTTAAVDAAAVYAAKCAGCHGANREGNTGIKAPALNATTLAGKADSALSDTIANGKTGTAMPAFKAQLSAAEINALITFIMRP